MGAHSKESLDLSIVIPLYNEVESVGQLVDSIEKEMSGLGRSWELIFVDDGSTDGTLEKLRAVCREHSSVRVIRLRRNFGQTAAMSAGFDHARGTVIVTMDG